MPHIKEKRKRRSNNVTIRLTDADMRKLDKGADALDCTRSVLIRQLIYDMDIKNLLER